MQPLLLTYRDAIDHCTDFLSGHSLAAGQRDIRSAAQFALREIESAHDWSYYNVPGRVPLAAPYATGTVTYVHSARVLTLSGGIWPSNARDCYVRVGDIVCSVESRTSDTQLVLDYDLNPGADVAIASVFSIYPAWYFLPEDFGSTTGPWRTDIGGEMKYVSPTQWLTLDRYSSSTGAPRCYTIMGVPDLHGSLGLFIHPASDQIGNLDYIYRRRARQMRYSGHAAAESVGTVTYAAGSNAVVGSSTLFNERMIGSVIRLGFDGTNIPSGVGGLYPFAEERIVASVGSATALALDALCYSAGTACKYVVSDVVDVDPAAVNAYLRCCEKHLAFTRNMHNKQEFVAAYGEALFMAKGGQHRVNQRMVAGPPRQIRRRLRDYPQGADVE